MHLILRPLLDLRNRIDYRLRSLIQFSPRLGSPKPSPSDRRLGAEVLELLNRFNWAHHCNALGAKLRVLDIGAKNFFLAETLESLFESLGRPCMIDGVEIDAFRRYRNFYTRFDYGQMYAKRIAFGQYYAMDFLDWREPCDIAVCLNPFVTEEPHRKWGLPTRLFRPQAFFSHVHHVLSDRGILLLSSPSSEEFDIASQFTNNSGYRLQEYHEWYPTPLHLQKQPRYTGLFTPRLRND